MTADRDRSDLPKAAEALLANWPAPERGALDWEQAADQTLSRVKHTSIGSTSDSLLDAPLPSEYGEPEQWVLGSESAGEPSDEAPGLADIARAAIDTEQAFDPELDAVAKETLSLASRGRPHAAAARPAARRRAPAEAAALQGRITSEPGPPRVSEPGPPRVSEPGPSRVADSAHSPTAPMPAMGRERVWILISGVSAALAIAAVAVLYVKARDTDVEQQTLPAPVAATPTAKALPTLADPAAPPPPAENAPIVPFDDLQKRDTARSSPTGAVAARPSSGPGSLANSKQAAAPPLTPKTAPSVELEEENDLRPATQELGVGAKPAVGEVQGAFGTVMPTARQCLAGQESGSQVTVTFGSDGRVQQVSVAGPAAGTAAEACLSTAFKGARVSPFSEPNFSAKITVRPP